MTTTPSTATGLRRGATAVGLLLVLMLSSRLLYIGAEVLAQHLTTLPWASPQIVPALVSVTGAGIAAALTAGLMALWLLVIWPVEAATGRDTISKHLDRLWPLASKEGR